MKRTHEIATGLEPVALIVTDRIGDVLAAWERLASLPSACAYAAPGFVGAWASRVAPTKGLEPRYVLATRAGEPAALLPLALGREGGVPMLTALSDTHSNMNGGLFAPDWNVKPTVLHEALLALEPKAEGIAIRCVPAPDGTHPLLDAPRPHVHDVYGGTFDGGFDGHLGRNNARRKRKKHRQTIRRFSEAGGWRVRRIDDGDEAEALLDEARALFATRFEREGIEDPFAPEPVRAFMTDALRGSVGAARPAMALWVLEVAGETIAIQAGGGAGDHFSLMFTVYRPGAHDGASPGDFLLHEVISAAAADGYASFDIGRGREPYKMSWCDVTYELHDVRVARTGRARLWFAAEGGMLALKRRVRGNDRLWELAKDVRRRLSRAA